MSRKRDKVFGLEIARNNGVARDGDDWTTATWERMGRDGRRGYWLGVHASAHSLWGYYTAIHTINLMTKEDYNAQIARLLVIIEKSAREVENA